MGEVFAGRYELIDLIGEGGSGTVWAARDAQTDRLVAAKVLRQSDAGALLRFVREQSVRIHHPHVVTPLGWAGEDDRVLFTMPIVRGGSVATLIGDHGALPPRVVAEILRQMLSGLAAVHEAGLVHRDLKPANILLDATGSDRPHAYVSDFGIAVDLHAPRWTETGLISGTPGFLAPELRAFGTLSPATDLYAVGQVGLTMVTGVRPGDREEPGRPSDCPESLWQALLDLTAVEPADRPASALRAMDLLAAPDLAWSPECMGEVEIFDQVAHLISDAQVPEASPVPAPAVPAETLGRADPAAVGEPVAAGGPAVQGPEPVATVSQALPATPVLKPKGTPGTIAAIRNNAATSDVVAPEQARQSGTTPGEVATGAARLPGWLVPAGIAALALLGVLLIWSPWQGGAPSDSGTATPRPSTTTASTAVGTGSAGATPGASPGATTAATPSASTGSVSIGRVVISVGQPCEFIDVGQRETTVDGTKVTCQLQANGTYAWLVP